MPEFAPLLQLSALDGTDGFRLDGEAAGDYAGHAVAAAGDVNGDGFDDFLIGAFGADGETGRSYLVFGGEGAPAIAEIDGVAAGDASGFVLAGAGDVNGDGFDDIVIGAYGADPNGSESGSAYVVFGSAAGLAAGFDLAALDGGNGFRIDGEAARDLAGYAVASAGDLNNDGFADVIVGARGADPNGSASGVAYVVFGKASGFSATLALSSLDGANGFQLNGEAAGDFSGRSVSSGDFNSDGFDDLLIGAPGADSGGNNSGGGHVIHGHAGPFPAAFELSGVAGGTGFEFFGEAADDLSARVVSRAGDVNADGIEDFIAGSQGLGANGGAHVVFGRVSGFPAIFDFDAIDGTNGFRVEGVAAGDLAGHCVSRAGDVNGDGYDDLIIGAFGADPHGSGSGAAYVVFGKASGFGASLALSALDGGNGFRIEGAAANDRAGFLVSAAGDIDNDGFDDLIVGAWGADPNGSQSGSSYVIYGHEALEAVTRTGTMIANTINGGVGGDTISGLGGSDTLMGRGGNDRLNGGSGDDTLRGGGGDDTYYVNTFDDAVFEDPASGADLVVAGLDWTLGSQLEHLTLSGAPAIDGTGNGTGNRITGNGAANELAGLGGNDTLNGAGGNDILAGGLGRDAMTGGSGADRFVFSSLAELGIGASADRIADFSAGTDTIDLTGLGLTEFIGSDPFTETPGEVRATVAGGLTIVSGDIDGDAATDFEIRLTGAVALADGDFLF